MCLLCTYAPIVIQIIFVSTTRLCCYGNPLPIPQMLASDPTLAYGQSHVAPAPITTALSIPPCDISGLQNLAVPQFGVDWPSQSQEDNERGRCAFNGAYLHPIVGQLIKQCRAKQVLKPTKRNISTRCPVSISLEEMQKQGDGDILHTMGKDHLSSYTDEYVKKCHTHMGMWGGGYTPSMECIISYFGRNFSPGFVPLCPPHSPYSL